MSTIHIKRQLITDALGNPIGIILPLEEFALVRDILEKRLPTLASPLAPGVDAWAQMEQAVNDPLFMADLRETMAAFSAADAEWSDPGE